MQLIRLCFVLVRLSRSLSAAFDYVSRNPVDDELLCHICHQPLVDPRMLACEHMFCAACLQSALAQKHACPVDRKPVVPQEDVKPVASAFLKLLGKSKVYCSNKASGCDWVGPRSNLLTDHLPGCDQTPCAHREAGCSWTGRAQAMAAHVASDCVAAPVACPHVRDGCTEKVRRDALEEHEVSCEVGARVHAEAMVREEAERAEAKAAAVREAHERRVEARKALCSRLNPKSTEVVTMNVGGRVFQTSLATLRGESESVLAQLFASGEVDVLERDETGRVFLDCDPDAFALVLRWLRSGVVPIVTSETTLDNVMSLARLLDLDRLVVGLGGELSDDEAEDEEEENSMSTVVSASASARTRVTPISTNVPVRAVPRAKTQRQQMELLQLIALFKSGQQQVSLAGMDLRGYHLAGMDLSCGKKGACLRGAVLANMDLSGVQLKGADLCNVDLGGCTLSGADLSDANMTDSTLNGADLAGANLTDSNLTGANLTGGLTGRAWPTHSLESICQVMTSQALTCPRRI